MPHPGCCCIVSFLRSVSTPSPLRFVALAGGNPSLNCVRATSIASQFTDAQAQVPQWPPYSHLWENSGARRTYGPVKPTVRTPTPNLPRAVALGHPFLARIWLWRRNIQACRGETCSVERGSKLTTMPFSQPQESWHKMEVNSVSSDVSWLQPFHVVVAIFYIQCIGLMTMQRVSCWDWNEIATYGRDSCSCTKHANEASVSAKLT